MIILRTPHGDVTKTDQARFETLKNQFRMFSDARKTMIARVQAKCLYAFAHDFMEMGMDEVTDQMLLEASVICPEYVEEYLPRDMAGSESFDLMATKLAEFYEEQEKQILKKLK